MSFGRESKQKGNDRDDILDLPEVEVVYPKTRDEQNW